MLDTARAPRQKCTQQDAGADDAAHRAPCGSRPVWCVVATKPRAERQAAANLHRYGFTAYVPWITSQRRDRSWITKPLWPGYVFVQLDLAKPWSPVRYAPGVFQLLMNGTQPAICPDHALEAVQNALQAAEAQEAVSSTWNVGQPCSLAVGPLRGMSGIVTAIEPDKNHARVAVMMLGQLRVVRIDTTRLVAREE